MNTSGAHGRLFSTTSLMSSEFLMEKLKESSSIAPQGHNEEAHNASGHGAAFGDELGATAISNVTELVLTHQGVEAEASIFSDCRSLGERLYCNQENVELPQSPTDDFGQGVQRLSDKQVDDVDIAKKQGDNEDTGAQTGTVGGTSAVTEVSYRTSEADTIIPSSSVSVDISFKQGDESFSNFKEPDKDAQVAGNQEDMEAAGVPKLTSRRITAMTVLASQALEAEAAVPLSKVSSDVSTAEESLSNLLPRDNVLAEKREYMEAVGSEDVTVPPASGFLHISAVGQPFGSEPRPPALKLLTWVEGQNSADADEAESQSTEENLDSETEEEASGSQGHVSSDDSEDEDEDSSYSQGEVPLKDDEVQELVDQLLKVESEAADAQEMLEEESIAIVKDEVKAELSASQSEVELDASVQEEIDTYIEQWEERYWDLQEQSSLIQEKLEDAGVSLPDLFKWIEKQAPEGCSTQAWKQRTHWAGHQPTQEVEIVVKRAEEDLKVRRPTRSQRGKLLDEGASGFLERKLAAEVGDDVATGTSKSQPPSDGGWSKVDDLLDNEEVPEPGKLMGTKRWAAVYLASTPEQAAQLGLALPGVHTVEEIGDLESEQRSHFRAAYANEKERGLTEQQQKSIKKVREEDDVKRSRRAQKRPRKRFDRQVEVKETLQENQAHFPLRDDMKHRGELVQPGVLLSNGELGKLPHDLPSGRSVHVIDLLSDDEGTREASKPVGHVGTMDMVLAESRSNQVCVVLNVEPERTAIQNNLYLNHGHSMDLAGATRTEILNEDVKHNVTTQVELGSDVKVAEKFHSGMEGSVNLIWSALPNSLQDMPSVPDSSPVPLFDNKRKHGDDGNDEGTSKRLKSLDLGDEGELSGKDQVAGSTPESSLPVSHKVTNDGRHPSSLDAATQYRTTVVIDSDGEREVEEPVTSNAQIASYSSRSSLSQTQNIACGRTARNGRLRVENTSLLMTGENVKCKNQIEIIHNIKKRKLSSKLEREKRDFACTACGNFLQKRDVLKHPQLPVGICKKCKKHYLSGPFLKDADGSDSECSWCGDGGEVVCCSGCDKVFCQDCITRNFGAGETMRIIALDDWFCYFCNPRPLSSFTDLLRQAESESGGVDVDLSDLDPEVTVNVSKRGKHRKNIRKVLDDDELEEKHKSLLELEKERQRRLEQWRTTKAHTTASQQFGQSKAITTDISGLDCEVTSNRLLINIAQEIGEEDVRIAPSLARVLKPHQISGVRFMWENCIVSERRVKEGGESFGCILAHSMGLGKTLQVITFIHTVLNRDLGLQTALIVVPVNVLHNWKREFEIWQADLPNPVAVYILEELIRENTKRASLLTRWQKSGGVMLIGYAAFRNLSLGKHVKDKETRDALCAALQNPGPDLLVCDEAHTIKNTKADITQVLKQVKTRRRIALTGSPLQNNLMEYYCMVDFVREGFLGSPHVFKNRFENPIDNGQHADSTQRDVRLMKQRAHVLHKQLKGFVQRVNFNVLKDELPPKCVYVISVRLSPLQRKLYAHYLQVHGLLQNEDEAENKSQRKYLFNAYHALAKVWNHPDLLLAAEERTRKQEDFLDDMIADSDEEKLSDADIVSDKGKTKASGFQRQLKKKASNELEEKPLWWKDIIKEDFAREQVEASGKMVLLLRLLMMSSAKGDKALVFSQSLGTLDIIERFLEREFLLEGKGLYWERDEHWYRLDGSTPAAARMQMCERFNDPSNTAVKCVLISTRAGSLGINLPAANRVIIVDGSWNPTYDLQALFRAWRLGQKKPVYAYRLLAHGTMEEKIYSRQVAKEGLAARVLDEQQVGRLFAGNDLEFLFRLEDDGDDFIFEETTRPQVLPIEPSLGHSSVVSGTPSGTAVSLASTSRSKLLAFTVPVDAPPRDDLMGHLLVDYRPRWVVSYHEHEPLLEHREEENLTTEEQAAAWESYKIEGLHTSVTQTLSTCVLSTASLQQVFFPGVDFGTHPGAICTTRDHAAMLCERNVPVGHEIICASCMQSMSWEKLGGNGGHKHQLEGK